MTFVVCCCSLFVVAWPTFSTAGRLQKLGFRTKALAFRRHRSCMCVFVLKLRYWTKIRTLHHTLPKIHRSIEPFEFSEPSKHQTTFFLDAVDGSLFWLLHFLLNIYSLLFICCWPERSTRKRYDRSLPGKMEIKSIVANNTYNKTTIIVTLFFVTVDISKFLACKQP